MHWVLLLAGGLIAWEDLRSREIHLYLIILFCGASSVIFFGSNQENHGLEIGLRLLTVMALLGLLYGYLLMRYGYRRLRSTTFFAWGDVLLLLAGLPLTDQYGLFLAVLISSILGLGYSFLARNATIPFAGIYALVVSIGYWLHQI